MLDMPFSFLSGLGLLFSQWGIILIEKLIILPSRLYINNSHNLKGQASRMLQTSVIKVIIDFMHVISPTVALHTDWPDEVLT